MDFQFKFYFTFTGASTYGGGGAGGRIAIYHNDTNHFTGQYIVNGGKGYSQWGGSGTVFLKDFSVEPPLTSLTTDNGGFQVLLVLPPLWQKLLSGFPTQSSITNVCSVFWDIEDIKHFSCSTQLSIKFKLLINEEIAQIN